jgi:hypothetical protein
MKTHEQDLRDQYESCLAEFETWFNRGTIEQKELIVQSLRNTSDLIDEELPEIDPEDPIQDFDAYWTARFDGIENFNPYDLSERERQLITLTLYYLFPWLTDEDETEVSGADTIEELARFTDAINCLSKTVVADSEGTLHAE